MKATNSIMYLDYHIRFYAMQLLGIELNVFIGQLGVPDQNIIEFLKNFHLKIGHIFPKKLT